MTTETKADEFKVGDRVWCVLYGEGVVTDIRNWSDSDEYYVQVTYCNTHDYDCNFYTLDGKFSKQSPRALFFSEPKIEASVTRPFVPTLVGKTVVIQYRGGRYFADPAMITGETSTHISSDEDLWLKKDIEAIYEVSSENLLK